MAVSVEEVHAEVAPGPVDMPRDRETERMSAAPDMDRLRFELRRDAERLARLWAD